MIIIQDIPNSTYIVMSGSIDVALFSTLDEAQTYIDENGN
jgi:hypothetical protein